MERAVLKDLVKAMEKLCDAIEGLSQYRFDAFFINDKLIPARRAIAAAEAELNKPINMGR